MIKKIWMAFDLGVTGDYDSLYAWLDDHSARECGDSLAYLEYRYTGTDFVKSLRRDLNKLFSAPTRKYRIYVIWNEGSKARGKFVLGGRKASPWVGYGSTVPQQEEEAA